MPRPKRRWPKLAAPTESWPTMSTFLTPRRATQAGDDAAAENILHGFTDRYPESIFDDQAPELEANILLAMNKLTAARQVLAAAAGTDAADRPAFQLAEGEVEQALGQQQAAEATFKQRFAGASLEPGSADGARQADRDGS